MGKCMKCGGSKKMGYMDLGGNFVDMTSQYKAVEPTSGYGAMEDMNKPKRPKGYDYKAHKRRGEKAFKNRGKCRRGPSGLLICE